MKPEHLRQILRPSMTVRDVADGLRAVLWADPVKAAQAVGTLYGNAFRQLEGVYEREGSRGRQELRIEP